MDNIDGNSNKQLKKIGVELGLFAIKLVKISGRLLTKLITGLAGFFSFLLKAPLYGVLTKIYFAIFRFKKTDLGQKSPKTLIREKTVYLFILLLTIILVSANLSQASQVNTPETKIPTTILAQIIPTELGDASQEILVEETANMNLSRTAGQEKYDQNSCTLDKNSSLTTDNSEEDLGAWELSDEGDLVYKPDLVCLNNVGDSSYVPAQRTQIIYYTVQNGDTISTISRRFGLTVNTILWSNNLGAYSLIRPGDQLTILPTSGVLYSVKKGDTLARIAQKYDVEVDKIISYNNLGNSLNVGQKIILPGAKKISETVAVSRSTASGNSRTGIGIIRDLIKSPPAPASGAKMTWPTVGYRISQYFTWRHNGVDIANKVGTPIYAAAEGVVITAQGGYNGGYGTTIVIDHGGGKKTRYGHLSKLFVKVGDEVERGENIGAMGSTGRSTGPHLHFEVLIGKTRYNPLNYIK